MLPNPTDLDGLGHLKALLISELKVGVKDKHSEDREWR
jgi:hypothetical protein